MVSHSVCCEKWYSIFIETINTSVESYSFTLQETSYNVVLLQATTGLGRFQIYSRIASIFVLLSAHVKTAVYQGMVM